VSNIVVVTQRWLALGDPGAHLQKFAKGSWETLTLFCQRFRGMLFAWPPPSLGCR
jgi:hypothetical protein